MTAPVNKKPRQGTSSKKVRNVTVVFTREWCICISLHGTGFPHVTLMMFNFQQIPTLVPKTKLTAHAPLDAVLSTKDNKNTKKAECIYLYLMSTLFSMKVQSFFLNYISLLSPVWEYTFYIGMFLRTNYKSTSV